MATPEEQELMAKIGSLAGKINRHKAQKQSPNSGKSPHRYGQFDKKLTVEYRLPSNVQNTIPTACALPFSGLPWTTAQQISQQDPRPQWPIYLNPTPR